MLAFEYCGKHIQAFFSKRFGVRFEMLESVEPVEIFQQFVFLCGLTNKFIPTLDVMDLRPFFKSNSLR